MKVHVLLPPSYAEGIRTETDLEEEQLRKFEDTFENDDEKVTVVEYCLVGCDDPIHATERTVYAHCPQHVHRSVNLILKKMPALEGVAQPLA